MKKFYLSIFWKFVTALILIVAFFGAINIYLIWKNVGEELENELNKRITYISKNISNQSIYYILYDDISSLQTLINNTLKSDSSIEYAFIINQSNEILAHSFIDGFPKGLIKINQNKKKTTQIIDFYLKNNNKILVKDISQPILNGTLGFVRIGINEESLRSNVMDTIINFIIVILFFTTIGIIGTFLFSFLITNPIKTIKETLTKLDFSSYKKYNPQSIKIRTKVLNRFKVRFRIYDEIDDLTDKVNEMILRLDKSYKELILANKTINQSEKLASIGTLVAGVVHEINNPLAGIQNSLRRIQKNPNNYEQNLKYYEIMDKAIQKMNKVIKGLLEFSRVSDYNFKKTEIKSMISKSLEILNFQLIKNNIELKFQMEDDCIELLCNENQIEQVIFNLISNSIDAINEMRKYVDNKHYYILINVTEEKDKIILSIEDNGIGIKNDILSKVFDPFFTTKEVGKGTGLGLSICYNIIKEHDGNIEIESEYKKGTKFIITFLTGY